MNGIRSVLSVLGPGIFAIGYTIGTGSVTSMAKAGADCGLGLLWVLALSCVFSGVLMEAYGRMAAVTGATSLRAMRDHLPCGKVFADFKCLCASAHGPGDSSAAEPQGPDGDASRGNRRERRAWAGAGVFAGNRLFAVGGVSSDNAADYLRAGCVGVAASGSLVNKEWVAAGEYGKIAEAAKKLVESCR